MLNAAPIVASLLTHLTLAAPPEGAPLTSPAVFREAPQVLSEGGVAGGPVTLRVRGRFVFQRAVEAVPATVGGARMRVEIWDQDSFVDELMRETETDEQGFFDTTFQWDDCDITGCDDPDLYIVVRAINDDHDIQRDSFLQTTWAWSTSDDVLEDLTATDIQLGSLQPADLAEHGAVHVHTVLALSRDTLAPVGFPVLTSLFEVDWSPDADTTELNGSRLSLSASDGWSECIIAREHLLFVFEEKTNTPLASLCNGICDDDGCSYCLWCIEPPLAAWRVGAATWYGDALSRSLPSITGAPPLATFPEIDATFPCPDGLPSNIHWVPGYVAALLRDLEDDSEIIDIDGDGTPDAPAETACERDSLARGISETVQRLFVGTHDDIDEFVDYLWQTSLPDDALWRTLRRLGGDTWTQDDVIAPDILSAFSPTHPGGVGPSPFVTLVVNGDDDQSGISGASIVWSSSLTATVDESVDVTSAPSGAVVVESPAIPYAGVLYLHIRLVDCLGNWSTKTVFGPLSVTDCDDDGIPDFCACGGCDSPPGYCPPEVCGSVADCNGNLVPDACEIESGAIADCNGDGVPDLCQGTTNVFSPPFGTGTALWNTASNWSLGSTPGPTQIACLDLNVPGYITRLQGATANVLGFGCDHTLEVQGMLQSATPSHAQRVDLSNGTITGEGDLFINDLRWLTGTITTLPNTSPTLTVGSFTTIGNFQKSLSRDTFILQDFAHAVGQLSLSNGCSLVVAPTAAASMAPDTLITWSTGSIPSLVNQGLFRKVAAGTARILWIPFTNEGTLEVAEGRLEVPGGSSTGSIEIGNGATLALQSGNFTLAPGSTLVGDRLELNGGSAEFGGDLTLSALALTTFGSTATLPPGSAIDVESVTFSNGTIDGPGDMTTSELNWTAGQFLGSGVATTGLLTMSGAGQKNLRRTLSVLGEASNSSSNVGLSQDGNLVIADDATLTLSGNAGFTWISGVQPGALTNHGTIRRTGSGLSNVTSVALTNHGVIDVEEGTLRLSTTGTHTGTLTGATVEVSSGTQSFGASSVINVNQLTVNGGTVTTTGGFANDAVTLSSGTLSISGSGFSTTNTMTMSGGTLAGSAPLTVFGPLQWTNGSMVGPGSIIVEGLSTLAGPGARTLRRPITALGSMLVTAAVFGVDEGGIVTIPSDAELAIAGGSNVTWVSGNSPGSLNIAGTLRKISDTGTSSFSFAPLSITGSIAIDGGTLQLGAPCTVSGSVTGAAGSELSLTGSSAQTFTSSAQVSVASLRLSASSTTFAGPVNAATVTSVSGTTDFDGTLTAGSWTHQNGTVGGTGSIVVNGPLTFSSGTLAGGSASMDLFGSALFSTSSAKSISRTLRVSGPAQWTSGVLAIGGPGGNAQMRIMPTGSLDIGGPTATLTWSVGSPGSMANEGLVRVLATSSLTISGVALTNSGTLDIDGPILRLSGSPNFVQSAGSTIVRDGSELEHSATVVVNGGLLTGSGRVDANVLVGNAVIAPGDSVGTLTVEGALTFQPSSTLRVTLGSAESDRLTTLGALACAGTIEAFLVDGFVPDIGDSFVIATCTSRTGSFSTVVAATPLPSDRRWSLQQNATTLTLVVVPALPCPGDLNLDGIVDQVDLALLLGAWGTDGLPIGADMSEDGLVSAPDLAILLGGWGPCPTGLTPPSLPAEGGVATNEINERGEPAPTLKSRSTRGQRLQGAASDDRPWHGFRPHHVEGAWSLASNAFFEHTTTLLLPTFDGCFVDASLIVIEGHAQLDGMLAITLDDALEIASGDCIRVVVADSLDGDPLVEVRYRGRFLPVEVEVTPTSLVIIINTGDDAGAD